MKKLLVLFFSVFFLLSASIIFSSAQENKALVYYNNEYIGEYSVDSYITFNQYMNASDATIDQRFLSGGNAEGKIQSFDLELTFDDEILEFCDCNTTDSVFPQLSDNKITNFKENGKIYGNMSNLKGIDFDSDDSILFSITFYVKSSGIININLDKLVIGGTDISHMYLYNTNTGYINDDIKFYTEINSLVSPVDYVDAKLNQYKIDVSWNDIEYADSYNVYYKKEIGNEWKFWKSVTDNFIEDSSISNGSSYYYGISSVNGNFESTIVSSNVVTYIAPKFTKIGRDYYCFDKDGNLVKGLFKLDNNYYFTDIDGKRLSGKQFYDGNYYYFDSKNNNVMLTGWQYFNGNYYYFEENKDNDIGHMYTGFQKVEAKGSTPGYFYFDNNGKMLTKWQKIDGLWYYFKGGTSGRMQTGWFLYNNNYYYLEENEENNIGHMYLGFKKVEAKGYKPGYFYFREENESGRMETSWKKIDNNWYYFKEGTSGRMLTGWITYNKNYYYLEENEENNIGHMYLGFQKVEATGYTPGYFYFKEENESGKMLTGWVKTLDGWRYFSNSGRMMTGWITIGSAKYYCDKDTGVMYTGPKVIDDVLYVFRGGDSGRLIQINNVIL